MPGVARAFEGIVRHRPRFVLAAVAGACCCVSAVATSQAGATFVWLGARPISPPGQVSEAGVAIDGSGDAAAVWAGPENAVEAAVRTADGLWQAPVVISQGVGKVGAPLVGTSATGQSVAVIWKREGTVDVAEGSLSPFEFHAPTMLSPESQGAGEPDLAMDAEGDEVSGWPSYENREKATELDFRPATSAPWLGPLVLSEKSPSDYAGAPPQVAIGAGGDAVAAWSRFTRTLPLTKEASYKPAGGAWQPPVTMPGHGTFSPIRLGVDAAGDAVAAWESEKVERKTLEASVRPAASGSWQAAQVIAESGLEGRQGSLFPSIGVKPTLAVGEDGEAILAWEAVRGKQRVVEVTTGSALTGAWQKAVVVATWPDWPSTEFVDDPAVGYPGPTPVAHPSVALAGDGEALLAWDDASSRFAGTVDAAVRPAPGAGWEGPVAVGSAATESAQVAIDPLGEAVVVWDRFAKGEEDVIESNVLARLGITRASLSHQRFRLHRHPSRIRAPLGARLRFDLSGPAQLTIAVTTYRSGWLIKGECGSKPLRRLPETIKKCTRTVSLGGWHETEPAGTNTISLTRRLAAMALHPGTYNLTVSAASGDERAAPVSLPFYLAR